MMLALEARLRALAAFARQRSFSGAAAELFISQPAVSKHIAELERQIGTALVIRQPRGGTLTPAGEFLAQYVLRAEALLAQAARGLEAFVGPGQTELHVATSGTPGTYLLPVVLAAFRRANPGATVGLRFGTSLAVVDAVRSHQSELGLVGGLVAAPELTVEPLLEDQVVLIGPPALGSRPLRVRELQSYTWVSREPGSATRAAVEAAWQDLGITPTSRLELPSWEAVKLAIASGAGIGACSGLALEVELKAGSLVILNVPRWKLRRTISAVYPTETPLTLLAERFLEALRQMCRRAAAKA